MQDGATGSPSTAQDQETETELKGKSISSSWTQLLSFLVLKETLCKRNEQGWLSVTSHPGQAQDSLLDPVFLLGGEFMQLNKRPEVFLQWGSLKSMKFMLIYNKKS